MKHCVQCGAPLAADQEDQRECDSCRETAAGTAAAAGLQAGPGGVSQSSQSSQSERQDEPAADWKDVQTYVRLLQGLIRDPEGSMTGAANRQGYIPGLVTAGIASLVVSLILLMYVRTLYGAIAGAIGGMSMFMGYWDIPYFGIFIRMLLFGLLQWALLSGLILVMARLSKQEMAPPIAFTIAGFAKFYFAAAAIIAMVAGFIHTTLGIGVIGGALALSTLLLYRGLQPYAPKNTVYFVAGLLCVYYVAQFVLIRLFV